MSAGATDFEALLRQALTPVSSAILASPRSKPRTYSRCQRNGGWTTTVAAPSSSAIRHERHDRGM